MADKKEKMNWNIGEQIRIAKDSFEKRPSWVKQISHFSGTNTSGAGNQAQGGEKSDKKK